MALEDEVRQASEQFYATLNRTLDGDPGPMKEIWSHGSDVSAMHPFEGRQLGWEEVRASWEQAAQAFSDGQVALDDVVVVHITEDAAYTLGTEHGQGKVGDETTRIDWRVTNVYRPRSGRMEDGAPPHRLLVGGGGSPWPQGGPTRTIECRARYCHSSQRTVVEGGGQ